MVTIVGSVSCLLNEFFDKNGFYLIDDFENSLLLNVSCLFVSPLEGIIGLKSRLMRSSFSGPAFCSRILDWSSFNVLKLVRCDK